MKDLFGVMSAERSADFDKPLVSHFTLSRGHEKRYLMSHDQNLAKTTIQATSRGHKIEFYKSMTKKS